MVGELDQVNSRWEQIFQQYNLLAPKIIFFIMYFLIKKKNPQFSQLT